jgi:hypothetical protein
MILTNAQRGDVIDALEIAIEDRASMIHSNLPPRRKNWSAEDKEDFAEWNGQWERFRKLRRAFLRVEKKA